MDHFLLLRDRIVDLTAFIAGALQAAARTRGIIRRTTIIVSELHDHKIAGLEHGQYAIPVALGHIRAAAEAAHRAVHHIDLLRVEVVDQRLTPSPLPVAAVSASIA